MGIGGVGPISSSNVYNKYINTDKIEVGINGKYYFLTFMADGNFHIMQGINHILVSHENVALMFLIAEQLEKEQKSKESTIIKDKAKFLSKEK